jgi:acetyl esterase/lipase
MHAYLLRYGTKVYWRLRLAKNRVKVDVPLRIKRNISYYGRLRKSHRLDIYRPRAITTPLPVIVFVHGGGWVMGSKFERRDIARELAAQGFVVVVINYRLSPEHRFPAGVIDGLRAMEWVKRHIAQYDGDPKNITLAGDSSGAHIAACVAAAAASKKLRTGLGVSFNVSTIAKKVVLYYGVYNLRTSQYVRRKYFKTYAKAYLGTFDFDNYKYLDYVSPIEYVSAAYPETLLIASEADPLGAQSAEMAQAIAQAGGKARLLMLEKSDYPDALHGFIADAATPHARKAFAAVCQFLRQR